MSIVIVSKSTALSSLVKQLVPAAVEVSLLEAMPEIGDTAWQKAKLAIIDHNSEVIVAAVSPLRQEGIFEDQRVIAKPYHPHQLQQAIRLMASIREGQEQAILEIGPYLLQIKGKYLMDRQQRVMVHLTMKEVGIIQHLLYAGTKGCTRETLLKEIWEVGEGIDTRTVETHVYRLRQKLSSALGEDNFIITEGTRYRLASL